MCAPNCLFNHNPILYNSIIGIDVDTTKQILEIFHLNFPCDSLIVKYSFGRINFVEKTLTTTFTELNILILLIISFIIRKNCRFDAS